MDYKQLFAMFIGELRLLKVFLRQLSPCLLMVQGQQKTIGKIANTKAGRFAIDVAQTMITNIIGDIERGKDFNKIDLTEDFIIEH